MRIALIIGGAACVWSDIDAALQLSEFDGVVACNDAGVQWPGQLDGWVSLHSQKLSLWAKKRAEMGRSSAKVVYGHTGDGNVGGPLNSRHAYLTGHIEFCFPGQKASGSSGLFAAKVALIDLGFDLGVLCGIPMTEGAAHFFDPAKWYGAHSHRAGWREAFPEIRNRLRSMSGWTKDLLGAPTQEWLAGTEETEPAQRVG